MYYLRQLCDESVNICPLGGVDDLVHGDLALVVPVGDVLGQSAVEQSRLLGDDAKARADVGNLQGLDVLALKILEKLRPHHHVTFPVNHVLFHPLGERNKCSLTEHPGSSAFFKEKKQQFG